MRGTYGDTRFDQFWAIYPRHVAKADAFKAWTKLNPTPDLVVVILDAVTWQRRQPSWRDPAFVPYPGTWIRGRRWEDEPFHAPAGKRIYVPKLVPDDEPL